MRLQLPDEIEDLRLHRDIERGRRLVGDQQSGIAGQRHGDHRALAHAARQLMRIAVDRLLRIGDVDLGQKVDGALAGRRLADFLMRQDLLGDLPADGVDRRQRGHRILEDHGDLAAAQLAHVARRQADKFAAAIGDRAFDDRIGIVDEAHDGEQRQGLARARFADDAQDLALRDIEGDAVDGAHQALLGAEGDLEIANLEHQHAPHARIEQDIDHVDQRIGHDDEERGIHDRRHDDRQVEVLQRVIGELADALQAEHHFGQKRGAADQARRNRGRTG